MRVRATRAAIVAAVLSIPAFPALGQSVLLRLNPEAGLVSRYVTGMETLMDNPMMPTDQPAMVGQVWSTQTVTSVEGDVVELEMVTDSADLSMPATPMMESQLPDMTGMVQIVKMDSRGRIIEADLGEDPDAQQVSGQMAGMGLQFPEGEVGPGESWSADIDYDLPGMPGSSMAMSMQLTYTLTEVSSAAGSQFATITFEGPVVMSGDSGGMGMQASGTTSGTMVFDVTKGRLTGTEMTLVIDIEMAGMAMAVTQSVHMTLIN